MNTEAKISNYISEIKSHTYKQDYPSNVSKIPSRYARIIQRPSCQWTEKETQSVIN